MDFQLLSRAEHCGFRNVLLFVQVGYLIQGFYSSRKVTVDPISNEMQYSLKQENPSFYYGIKTGS